MTDEKIRQNIVVLESFYEALSGGEFGEKVKSFLSKEVIWHIAGENPLAGDVFGADAVLERISDFSRLSRQTLKLKTSLTATSTHGIAIHEATAQNSDFDYFAHEIDVFHIENGLIIEFWSFSEDQKATDRMWT